MAATTGEFSGGELLFCGGTDWATLGRGVAKNAKKDPQEEIDRQEMYPNLLTPHRLKPLMGIQIKLVAAGSAACHCVVADTTGACYTWGRNEKGQLGLGDQLNRNNPTLVPGLAGKEIVTAAAGKFHTVVVTSTGESYTFGSNLQSCCCSPPSKTPPLTLFPDPQVHWPGQEPQELLLQPAKALVSGCSAVSCGAEFTMWLCQGGKLFSAGMPQYGQLGDGSEHMYNAKESSIKLMFDPQPTPKQIAALANVTVLKVACGHNHTVAIDSEHRAYSWGNGGYGRLGHKVQQDELAPKVIDTFKGRLTVPNDAMIGAGQTSSFCSVTGGQLYAWGKLKVSGDNTMYPQPFQDLSGWNIRGIACGPQTFAVAADDSAITWGGATNGELGYGALGKKSSARPDKVPSLEGMRTHAVACGVGFTAFVVTCPEERMSKLPVFESTAPEEMAVEVDEDAGAAPAPAKGKGKGKAAAAKAPKAAPAPKAPKAAAKKPPAKKAKKNAEEDEGDDDEEDEAEDDDYEAAGKKKRKAPAKPKAAPKKKGKAAA